METIIRILKRRGLAVKLSLFTLIGTTIIFVASFAYNYWYSSRLVLQNVETNAANLSQANVYEVETVLYGIEKVVMFIASYLEHHDYNKEDLLTIINHIVSTNDEIYGSTVAYEPYAFEPDEYYFAPYYYKHNGILTLKYLSGEAYQYHQKDWYTIPKSSSRPTWSEPYYDKGGG